MRDVEKEGITRANAGVEFEKYVKLKDAVMQRRRREWKGNYCPPSRTSPSLFSPTGLKSEARSRAVDGSNLSSFSSTAGLCLRSLYVFF